MSFSERLALAALVATVYVLFCFWSGRRHRRPSGASATSDTLVAYASQTGTAVTLAKHTVAALQGQARLLPLNQVDDQVLAVTRRALIIASTYGHGEPPDNGALFARRHLTGGDPDLSHLSFAVLSLGDSSYPDFCGFGRNVHQGLRGRRAIALAEPIEIDSGHSLAAKEAVDRWYLLLRQMGAMVVAEGNSGPDSRSCLPWVLVRRTLLNPGSPGQPLFHLKFAPPQAERRNWQAGDIVEVVPLRGHDQCLGFAQLLKRDPSTPLFIDGESTTLAVALAKRQLPELPVHVPTDMDRPLEQWLESLPLIEPRKYSIASIDADGTLDLIVRQQRNKSGQLGLASGWLTQRIAEGDSVGFSICSNAMFRSPGPETPLVLIGSGSGFAGLRAHLRRRQREGGGRNWLLFGERHPDADRIFSDEIENWRREGTLEKLDLVYSRCSRQPMYVQDCLSAHAERLLKWVKDGAVIMVCGSRLGMGQGVDGALAKILGRDGIDRLLTAGRYRRDLY